MNNLLLKTAAAYIRVSDERQDEYSPDSQLKLVRAYADKHDLYLPDDSDHIFYDDGISGKSAKNRDRFQDMIAAAKRKDHPFDVILVWKYSRFCRNQEESIVYKSLLRKIGVDVISVSEPLVEGPFGSLVERVLEWEDEYYLTRLAGEVRRGMNERFSRGQPVVAPPFGYSIDSERNLYYPNDQAPLVVEIFERYAAGDGFRKIASCMGERGMRTRFGNPPDNRQIEYILHNPTYIGKLRWSKGGRTASKRDYANANMLLIDGAHDPIITAELWEAVQKRLEEEKKKYQKYARREQPIEYAMKGLVRCSDCGSTLVLCQASGPVPYLQCHAYAKGSCHHSHCISMKKANASLVSSLQECLDTDTFRIAPEELPKADRESESAKIEKALSRERNRLRRAKESYLDGTDSIEEYRENKRRITARIADLEALAAEHAAKQPAFDTAHLRSSVESLLLFLQDPTATEPAKSSALRAVIHHIVFDKSPTPRLTVFFHAN